MQQVFVFLRAVVSVYTVVIVVRILLTWLGGVRLGRAHDLLIAVTDPYLNWFRRNMSIRVGALDFSAVLALMVLSIVARVLDQLARVGAVTLGFVLSILVASVWSVIAFVITLFLILAGLRLVAMLAQLEGGGRFWNTIEMILNPTLQVVVKPFLRNRFRGYRESLVIFVAVLLGVLLVGRFLVTQLVALIQLIPV